MTAERLLEILLNEKDAAKIIELKQKYESILKNGQVSYEQLQIALQYDFYVFNKKNQELSFKFMDLFEGTTFVEVGELYELEKYRSDNISTHINSFEEYEINKRALKLAYECMIEDQIENYTLSYKNENTILD